VFVKLEAAKVTEDMLPYWVIPELLPTCSLKEHVVDQYREMFFPDAV